jgi:hypothetical protein
LREHHRDFPDRSIVNRVELESRLVKLCTNVIDISTIE